jgi:tripartite ATP-independent transporter DctM subunit
MEWYYVLLIIFGGLIFLMLTGLPIAFCFFLTCTIGMYVYFGGAVGVEQLVVSMWESLNSFLLLPIMLFILMGEVMFHSGVAPVLIGVIDKWLGRVPGRLSLLAVAAGTLFSALTGTSLANVAMLGSTLVPEMEKEGYDRTMSMGPILATGGLAQMIPPSNFAVLLGAIAEVSVGKILMAIILPGILMAAIYTSYIIIRCTLQPSLAPAREVRHVPLPERLKDFVFYVLPQGLVVFFVIGVIFLGVATPSEAAATGAAATIVVAFFYKRMSWEVIKKSVTGTVAITSMILIIIAGATAFGQILAFSHATAGMSEMVLSLKVRPIIIIIAMQIVILIMGAFMDIVAIMMITVPIFMPVVKALNFDPVWFCVLVMMNLEVAIISPPFGMSLFVLKGVCPKDVTMMDIYRAATPFVLLILLSMAVVMVFPGIALFLPGLMR